jgi:hypothetical protein
MADLRILIKIKHISMKFEATDLMNMHTLNNGLIQIFMDKPKMVPR